MTCTQHATNTKITTANSNTCIAKTQSSLESVSKLHQGLQSFRSMRRMEASFRNARALRLRFSQSLARRRQRLGKSQPQRSRVRSEEHTSELQSHSDLVCRHLLET